MNKLSEERTDVKSFNGTTNSRRIGRARMGELTVSILRDGQELVDRPCEKRRCVTNSRRGMEYAATKGRRQVTYEISQTQLEHVLFIYVV